MTEQTAGAIRSVAVIGVGNMGEPMARFIQEAGFGLTVCDTNADVLTRFAKLGVRTAATPAGCTDSDAVIILVATPAQLRAVATGENGLLSIARERMPRYVVVSSTVAPEDMQDLAQAFVDLPTRVVDAPVSGGVVGAQRGTLTFLVGGSDDDVEALGPLFTTMGKTIFHCGPLGGGQTIKAINNVIAISNLMISAEAYAIALANGVTLDRLIPALDAGSARNFLSRDPGDPPEVYQAWSGTERAFEDVRSIHRKDLALAVSLGRNELALPAIAALQRLIEDIGGETLDNWRTVAKAPGVSD